MLCVRQLTGRVPRRRQLPRAVWSFVTCAGGAPSAVHRRSALAPRDCVSHRRDPPFVVCSVLGRQRYASDLCTGGNADAVKWCAAACPGGDDERVVARFSACVRGVYSGAAGGESALNCRRQVIILSRLVRRQHAIFISRDLCEVGFRFFELRSPYFGWIVVSPDKVSSELKRL